MLKLSDHTLVYNYGMFHVCYGLTLLGSCLTWIPSHCTLCGDTISQSYAITTMVPSKPALVRLYLKPHPMVTQKLRRMPQQCDIRYQLPIMVCSTCFFFSFFTVLQFFLTFLAFSFLKRWKPNKEVRKYIRLYCCSGLCYLLPVFCFDWWLSNGAILKLPAQHYTTRKSILHKMADIFPEGARDLS